MGSTHFPEKIFCAKQKDSKLSYVTEYGTDSAAKKRMKTGTNWAGKDHETFIYENTPQTGFKIIDNVTRWRTSNQVWRVEDPRGFVIEIYSGNMMKLLTFTTIKNGEIQDACIWARDSGDNILVPVESNLYKEVTSSQREREAETFKMSELVPGASVEIKDSIKSKGIYIGKAYEYARLTDNGIKVHPKPKPVHVFYLNKRYVARASLPVVVHNPPIVPSTATIPLSWFRHDDKLIASEKTDLDFKQVPLSIEKAKFLNDHDVFLIKKDPRRYGNTTYYVTSVKSFRREWRYKEGYSYKDFAKKFETYMISRYHEATAYTLHTQHGSLKAYDPI